MHNPSLKHTDIPAASCGRQRCLQPSLRSPTVLTNCPHQSYMCACSVLWMSVSSALIVLNKQLLSVVGFHYPMALSGLGMAFSSLAGFVVCKVSLATCLCCLQGEADHCVLAEGMGIQPPGVDPSEGFELPVACAQVYMGMQSCGLASRRLAGDVVCHVRSAPVKSGSM